MENGNAPATKQDIHMLDEKIETLRSELKQDNEMLRSELKQDNEMLRSELHHSFDELKETFRDTQTELLKAFYNYSQTNDARVGAVEQESATLKKRLAIVESRITDVERRLNTPPQ